MPPPPPQLSIDKGRRLRSSRRLTEENGRADDGDNDGKTAAENVSCKPDMQESDKKSCCGGGSTSESKPKPCGRCRRAGVTTTTTAEPSIATDGRCDECGRRLSSDADTVTTTADTAAERTRFSSGQPVLERKTGVTAAAAARYDIGRTATDLPAPCADLPCRDTRRVDQPSGTPTPAEYSQPFRRIAYVTGTEQCNAMDGRFRYGYSFCTPRGRLALPTKRVWGNIRYIYLINVIIYTNNVTCNGVPYTSYTLYTLKIFLKNHGYTVNILSSDL